MEASPKTVVLNDDDFETTEFLKKALNCKTNDEVVSESLNATRHVVRVIRDGGTVILKKKNGRANNLIMNSQ